MYNNNEIITNIRLNVRRKDTWAEYSKLVLKELERLNDNHERMRSDFDNRFNEINTKLSEH
jgi:predicted nucleic acid-binding protein